MQKLDSVASAAAKRKDRTRTGILPELLLRFGSQTYDAFPHVCIAAGQIDPNASAGSDHDASTMRIMR